MNFNRNTYIGIAAGLVIFTFVALAFCSNADAREWYVKAEVGSTFDSEVSTSFGAIELADGPVYGAHVGTSVGPVRVEAGVRHLSGDLNFGPISVDTSAVNYTATAYLDLGSDRSGFFVGAGPDYYQAEAQFGPFTADTEGAGWHVSGGYAHRISDRAVAEVGVRYGEADLDGLDLSGVTGTVGVRFRL